MVVDRDVSTTFCWSSTGDDVDWLYLNVSSTVAVKGWRISIIAVVVNVWRILIPIVLGKRCSLTRPLSYRLTVMLFDSRHPRFWSFILFGQKHIT